MCSEMSYFDDFKCTRDLRELFGGIFGFHLTVSGKQHVMYIKSKAII